jgi:hypothetical protein
MLAIGFEQNYRSGGSNAKAKRKRKGFQGPSFKDLCIGGVVIHGTRRLLVIENRHAL